MTLNRSTVAFFTLLSAFVATACDPASDSSAATDSPAATDRGATPQGKADGAGSCEGACGSQADAGCWCDDQCADYGDCCSDYEDTCVPSSDGWKCKGVIYGEYTVASGSNETAAEDNFELLCRGVPSSACTISRCLSVQQEHELFDAQCTRHDDRDYYCRDDRPYYHSCYAFSDHQRDYCDCGAIGGSYLGCCCELP